MSKWFPRLTKASERELLGRYIGSGFIVYAASDNLISYHPFYVDRNNVMRSLTGNLIEMDVLLDEKGYEVSAQILEKEPQEIATLRQQLAEAQAENTRMKAERSWMLALIKNMPRMGHSSILSTVEEILERASQSAPAEAPIWNYKNEAFLFTRGADYELVITGDASVGQADDKHMLHSLDEAKAILLESGFGKRDLVNFPSAAPVESKTKPTLPPLRLGDLVQVKVEGHPYNEAISNVRKIHDGGFDVAVDTHPEYGTPEIYTFQREDLDLLLADGEDPRNHWDEEIIPATLEEVAQYEAEYQSHLAEQVTLSAEEIAWLGLYYVPMSKDFHVDNLGDFIAPNCVVRLGETKSGYTRFRLVPEKHTDANIAAIEKRRKENIAAIDKRRKENLGGNS